MARDAVLLESSSGHAHHASSSAGTVQRDRDCATARQEAQDVAHKNVMATHMPEIEQLQKMEQVDLTGLRLAEDQMCQIGSLLFQSHRLRSLHLIDCGLGDSGVSLLSAALRYNASVFNILLTHNNIGDKGVEDLADALRDNLTLTSLILTDNVIGNAGCKAMADTLRTNRSLQVLNLGFNLISGTGVRALAASLEQNYAIKDIVIVGNTKVGFRAEHVLKKALERDIDEIRKNATIHEAYHRRELADEVSREIARVNQEKRLSYEQQRCTPRLELPHSPVRYSETVPWQKVRPNNERRLEMPPLEDLDRAFTTAIMDNMGVLLNFDNNLEKKASMLEEGLMGDDDVQVVSLSEQLESETAEFRNYMSINTQREAREIKHREEAIAEGLSDIDMASAELEKLSLLPASGVAEIDEKMSEAEALIRRIAQDFEGKFGTKIETVVEVKEDQSAEDTMDARVKALEDTMRVLTEEYTARQVEAAAQTAFLELISSDPALEAYYHNVRGKLEAFFAASLMRATGMVGRRIGEVQHAMGATTFVFETGFEIFEVGIAAGGAVVPFGSIAASIIGAFAEKVIYNTWETKRVKKIAKPVTTLESCTKLSTELGRILVYTYEDQLRKLSVRGAMQLAKYLGARLFSYMANGHLREDMPVPEQLVAGLAKVKVDDDGQVQLNIVEKDDMEEVRLQSTEMKPETLLQKIRATKRKLFPSHMTVETKDDEERSKLSVYNRIHKLVKGQMKREDEGDGWSEAGIMTKCGIRKMEKMPSGAIRTRYYKTKNSHEEKYGYRNLIPGVEDLEEWQEDRKQATMNRPPTAAIEHSQKTIVNLEGSFRDHKTQLEVIAKQREQDWAVIRKLQDTVRAMQARLDMIERNQASSMAGVHFSDMASTKPSACHPCEQAACPQYVRKEGADSSD